MKKLIYILLLIPLLNFSQECECDYLKIMDSTIVYKGIGFGEVYENLNQKEFNNTLLDIEEYLQWDMLNRRLNYKSFKNCLKIINKNLK